MVVSLVLQKLGGGVTGRVAEIELVSQKPDGGVTGVAEIVLVLQKPGSRVTGVAEIGLALQKPDGGVTGVAEIVLMLQKPGDSVAEPDVAAAHLLLAVRHQAGHVVGDGGAASQPEGQRLEGAHHPALLRPHTALHRQTQTRCVFSLAQVVFCFGGGGWGVGGVVLFCWVFCLFACCCCFVVVELLAPGG